MQTTYIYLKCTEVCIAQSRMKYSRNAVWYFFLINIFLKMSHSRIYNLQKSFLLFILHIIYNYLFTHFFSAVNT